VDFIVVGSGAAGGVIAREPSQAALTVLVFEQGPRLSPADFEHDELKYWFLTPAWWAAAAITTPRISGASTKSTSTSAACTAAFPAAAV